MLRLNAGGLLNLSTINGAVVVYGESAKSDHYWSGTYYRMCVITRQILFGSLSLLSRSILCSFLPRIDSTQHPWGNQKSQAKVPQTTRACHESPKGGLLKTRASWRDGSSAALMTFFTRSKITCILPQPPELPKTPRLYPEITPSCSDGVQRGGHVLWRACVDDVAC